LGTTISAIGLVMLAAPAGAAAPPDTDCVEDGAPGIIN
jgi:hypothetical protein